jgi:Flp pilus assembly protein TadD
MQNILGWPKSYDSRDAEISRLLSNVRPHQGNPDSHYLLACYYQERGRHKEALEEFKKVLFIDPNYVKAYNGMGVSHDLLADFSSAIEFYKQALKINPDMDYVHNNLGYSYLLQGNFDGAVTAFKNAIGLNNQNTRFHNNLGLAYGEKGQYDLALAEFKLAGDEAKAHHSIAQIYFKNGLYDEAKNHYGIALKLNPSLTVVRTVLKATDALAKIFEPIPGKVEPKQLIVPDQPRDMAKIENLNVSNQLTTMETEPEGINNHQPHLSSIQISNEEMTVSNQQPKLKEVSFSYDISKEDKEPVVNVEKVKEVAEAKEIKKEEVVKEKTMEAPPVAQANPSAPEKVHPDSHIAIPPSEARLRAVERLKKAKEIVDVSLEEKKKDSITYSIVADGKIGDYDVFQLDSPSRLVLDIKNMGNHYPKTGIWTENPFIRVVRIGHYPDKMRFVFDSLNFQLPPYQVTRMDPKLMVSFGNIPQPDEPKIYAKETPSPKKEAASVLTKTPFETSRNGKLAIEISNGNGVNNMARMVGDYLKGRGFRVTRLTNAAYFNHAETKIFYQKEYHEGADQVAEQLPVVQSREETEKFDRANINIKILIGKDLVPYYKLFENGKES